MKKVWSKPQKSMVSSLSFLHPSSKFRLSPKSIQIYFYKHIYPYFEEIKEALPKAGEPYK